MRHKSVELAVEKGDISSLKYIFRDCLDGDPTFKKYQEDYDYCVQHGVLFEPHVDLHPMVTSPVDDEYWIQLKDDFMQNPSKERLEHMKDVAKILYKDRIARIQAEEKEREERAKAVAEAEEKQKQAEEAAKRAEEAAKVAAQQPPIQPANFIPPSYSTEQNERPKSVVRRATEPSSRPQPNTPSKGTAPKKASGTGLIPILILAAIVVIVILIVKHHNQ